MIKIDEQGRQISETDVASLEAEFGEKLPNSYRQFLLANNGGVPSPDVVDVTGAPGSPTDVQVFFGIGRDIESSDLFWNLRVIEERFPGRRILPIACDSGGNLFCLQAPEGGGFEVTYMDLDDPGGTLYEGAPNFDAFLQKIRPWK
jgi:hypothetical protein